MESENSEMSEEDNIILYMMNVSEEGQSSNNEIEYEEYNEQISSKEGICERRITFNEKQYNKIKDIKLDLRPEEFNG